ncbi:up-regulator of cell proliferation-like [Pelmatolapia mariae]|uniref:up-regulator of cell proliferation-like n=1 Tax=Pelmatolapia mariae TaxID=158779 RepID=UPI002FE60B5B
MGYSLQFPATLSYILSPGAKSGQRAHYSGVWVCLRTGSPGDSLRIQFPSVKPNSVVLSWGNPKGLEGPKSFRIMWSSLQKVEGRLVIKNFHKIEISNLELGQEYFFSVATEDEDGNLSEWVTATVFTVVPPPRHLTKEHSDATSLTLKWMDGEKMEGIPQQFLIAVESPGKEPLVIHTNDYCKKVSDLEPDTKYTISVSTVVNDRCSEPISICTRTVVMDRLTDEVRQGSLWTTMFADNSVVCSETREQVKRTWRGEEPSLRQVLSKIGLEDQYDTKLTLSTFLEINQYDRSQRKPKSARAVPEAFLKQLMSLNTNARSATCVSQDEDKCNAINLLDLVTALFLCSDSALQQDLVLKMSLCQFAVPLLLPNSETKEITMMLWSMRDIVRTFRPSQQAFLKSYCDERLVLSDIPLVSFVRLGKTSLSKSQMLNKLLCNNQQIHHTFCHRSMACCDVPRRISDGLVEISWYLPCGNMKIDKFTEPLAFTNLRGDIKASERQFAFLCQASAAVYIYCDESETNYFKHLEGKHLEANIFLISSTKGKSYRLKQLTVNPRLKMTDISQIKKTDTELLKALQESVSKMLVSPQTKKVSLADLAYTAHCCQILVDEDRDECQSAWENASKITAKVTNISEFKDKQLPYQGNIWKAISWVETECWRLRKVGNNNPDNYCESIKEKEKGLRNKQRSFEMTTAVERFHHGMTTSEVQRYHFLKWLEMELDNLSRHQLSALQDRYKELRQKSLEETKEIVETDNQISACSLRVDHFVRECGQLYNNVSCLPEYSRQRKNIEQLPGQCAQMMLDGFPLELVDGDAANIPIKWISQVLTELHNIMNSSSKLKVITVIGAENSGKSTLLNTMFGVRFAVNAGTCTRGAFIQLISVSKDIRKELGCDCIMLIDTEGLKSHRMVRDDHSHERDKEVASIAVALSDVVVVSISNDSSREKDLWEMVCHAFARLKGVSKKKPVCHFVHTNMYDMPALEQLKRSKELMEQLNEMIGKDVKMKKANINKLSDVIKFDLNNWSWYIPPVWDGTPPMAPVNVGYSATVYTLKKVLINDLQKCPERGDLIQFIGKVEQFWKTV